MPLPARELRTSTRDQAGNPARDPAGALRSWICPSTFRLIPHRRGITAIARGCKVQTTPEFKAGYYKMASHELLAVEECPISSALINRGIAALWLSGRAGKVPTGVDEVEFFANADDTQLLVEVSAKPDSRRAALRAWAEDFRSSMAEIAGVVAFREAAKGAPGGQEKLLTVGADHLDLQDGAGRVPGQCRVVLPDESALDRRTGENRHRRPVWRGRARSLRGRGAVFHSPL